MNRNKENIKIDPLVTEPAPAKKRSVLLFVSAAACACFVLVGLFFLSVYISSGIRSVSPGEGFILGTLSAADTALNGNTGQIDLSLPAEGPNIRLTLDKVRITPVEFEVKDGQPLSVAQITRKVMPSVVGILAESGDFPGMGSAGSGIIATADGYIITNAHVIEGMERILVVLHDGQPFHAEVIGADARTDLALLRINKTGLTPAEFGDSDLIQVGDLAVAIGNPLGLELQGTVTQGIISAINRNVYVNDYTAMTLIQTDAAINPGNSGGPLINQYGQVIGINTRKLVDVYIEGIGFAIPYNSCEPVILELAVRGYIGDRPSIGIRGSDIDEATAKTYNVPYGVHVDFIEPFSDAALQGLKVGDVITHFNGKRIMGVGQLNAVKNKLYAGDQATVTVYRKSTRKTLDITFMLMDEKVVEENSTYGQR